MTTANFHRRMADFEQRNQAALLTYAALVSVVSIAVLLTVWGAF